MIGGFLLLAVQPQVFVAHTQLGTRTSKSQARNPTDKQWMEFNRQGKRVRQTDYTDHGRKTHPNPHYHDFDPATGRRDRTPRPVYPWPKPPRLVKKLVRALSRKSLLCEH
jgi:hypothetical protein